MNAPDIMRNNRPTYLGHLIIQFMSGRSVPWSELRFNNAMELKLSIFLDRLELERRRVLVFHLDHRMPAHRN